MPVEYRRALAELKAREAEALPLAAAAVDEFLMGQTNLPR
jgi:hypothetical protein